MANVRKKQFQDYTLEERQVIWNTLKEALDEAGHDEMQHEVVNQLPKDEKEYMDKEQFNGIAFDPNDFKDVAVIQIIDGNGLDAGEGLDFDAILSQAKQNQKIIPDLEETPMDKAREKAEIDEILARIKKTGKLRFEKDEKYVKSLLNKSEKKIPVDDDDTVEIEEMDGKKYVEIEPKEEHAEEVETGYEEADDDLNTEDNITHPDTSKPKEKAEKSKPKIVEQLTPQQAIQKCATYQAESKLIGLMDYEIKELTGYDADRLLGHMAGRGRVRKAHCADGTMYSFRM